MLGASMMRAGAVVGVQEAGISINDLDFSINHSGADIWHNGRRGGSKGSPRWGADEKWEEHINFRCPPLLSQQWCFCWQQT